MNQYSDRQYYFVAHGHIDNEQQSIFESAKPLYAQKAEDEQAQMTDTNVGLITAEDYDISQFLAMETNEGDFDVNVTTNEAPFMEDLPGPWDNLDLGIAPPVGQGPQVELPFVEDLSGPWDNLDLGIAPPVSQGPQVKLPENPFSSAPFDIGVTTHIPLNPQTHPSHLLARLQQPVPVQFFEPQLPESNELSIQGRHALAQMVTRQSTRAADPPPMPAAHAYSEGLFKKVFEFWDQVHPESRASSTIDWIRMQIFRPRSGRWPSEIARSCEIRRTMNDWLGNAMSQYGYSPLDETGLNGLHTQFYGMVGNVTELPSWLKGRFQRRQLGVQVVLTATPLKAVKEGKPPKEEVVKEMKEQRGSNSWPPRAVIEKKLSGREAREQYGAGRVIFLKPSPGWVDEDSDEDD